MRLIDQIRKGAKVVIDALTWPYRENTIIRAFDRKVQTAEVAALKIKGQKAAVYERLVTLDISNEAEPERAADRLIQQLIDLDLELEVADKEAAVSKKAKEAFFADVPDIAPKED